MTIRARGFSLVELMIVIAILAVLSAIAVPQYSQYVMRARLTEAFTALGGAQPNAEQYWANNRTYEIAAGATDSYVPPDSANFTYSLDTDENAASTSTYTLKASGRGAADRFEFTINQKGDRATTGTPDGWTKGQNCWSDRKDGSCTN